MKKTIDKESRARRSAPSKTERDGKVFVGFWTSQAAKSAIQTRAMLDRKSASALMDEIVTDWLCGRRRK